MWIDHPCRRLIGALALVMLPALAGCDTLGGTSRTTSHQAAGFARARLPEVTMEAVRPVADQVFRQHFRVDADASSPANGIWISRPAEATEAAESETPRVRGVLAGDTSRRRQIAELHLTQEGSAVIVRCQVLMQRLDTAERAAFARERGDDRPTDTPIERAGASSASTRQEWVDVGRDRQTERLILETIQDRFLPPQ